MKYIYNTQGTCSKQIILDIDDNSNKIIDIQFVGGCPGNTLGISTILKNMDIDSVISKFEGIHCGMKSTSCPDQLAKALKSYKTMH